MTFLKLAWRNIWRNKRRTLITVASIFFAVSLTTIMRSLLEGVYSNMVKNIAAFSTGYIQVHKKGYWEEKNIDNIMQMNQQLKKVLESNKNITATMPRIETFAFATTGEQSAGVMLMGIEPESENSVTHLADRIISGAYLDSNDDGVIIGSSLARRLQLEAGDTIILMTQGYHAASANYMGVVKGVLKLGSPVLDKVMVYMPLKAAQQLLSLEDQLTGISIMISSTSEMEKVKRELKETVDTAA